MNHILFLRSDELSVGKNRQRRIFNENALADLSKGIQEKGLFHPLVVRKDENGYTLVAGERRKRAIELSYVLGISISFSGQPVPPETFPCVLISDLDDVQMEEAELEENVLREDLTWQERAAAESRLHQLRSKQKESKGEYQTLRQTAAELLGKEPEEVSTAKISRSLVLAEHLDDPDISGAKSPKDAMRILEKKAKRQHRENLAKAFDAAKEGNPTGHEIHLSSMEDFIVTIPDASIDVILTDPPYGIDAQNFGDQVKLDHDYHDDEKKFWPMMQTFAEQSYRVAKAQAHLYMFCDVRFYFQLKVLFAAQGWDVWATPQFWFKANGIGIVPRPKHGPRRTYECIMYAIKGGKEINFVGGDVLAIPADMKREHGAQKPVELFEEILARSANPGDLVADFFVGSGPIYPAAEKHRCRAIGCENKAANYGIAVERIKAMYLEDGDEATVPEG